MGAEEIGVAAVGMVVANVEFVEYAYNPSAFTHHSTFVTAAISTR
jgi:hypothetical protein